MITIKGPSIIGVFRGNKWVIILVKEKAHPLIINLIHNGIHKDIDTERCLVGVKIKGSNPVRFIIKIEVKIKKSMKNIL